MVARALVLITLAGIAEAALLAFAASADVSPEYRAYYIDRTTGCLPRQVSGEYALGAKLSLEEGEPQKQFDDIAVCGFADSEPDGAWLRGPEARLHVALRTPQTDLAFEIVAQGAISADWPRQHAVVVVNGTRVGEFEYPDRDWQIRTVRIPRQLAEGGLLDIALLMSDVRRPGSRVSKADARRFSLFVRSVQLKPVQ